MSSGGFLKQRKYLLYISTQYLAVTGPVAGLGLVQCYGRAWGRVRIYGLISIIILIYMLLLLLSVFRYFIINNFTLPI